ncbi:hypothetical protein B9Y64_06350 [Stenotrophomonas maltophilia]|uniref:Uncharacterized protein n=1 Tax=Stenotrophomonas maltophilia TaxID=40324 RepID=A0A2J0UCN1_STEMA|nr:hypothetical protein B9Y64_06350 [Stenotrophomonas maltophilia]
MSPQTDVLDLLHRALVVLPTQHAIISIEGENVALLAAVAANAATMRIIGIGLPTGHIAQAIAQVKPECLTILLGQISLNVVVQADDRTAIIAVYVGHPITGVIPVVVLLHTAQLGTAQVVQHVVGIAVDRVAAKGG